MENENIKTIEINSTKGKTERNIESVSWNNKIQNYRTLNKRQIIENIEIKSKKHIKIIYDYNLSQKKSEERLWKSSLNLKIE